MSELKTLVKPEAFESPEKTLISYIGCKGNFNCTLCSVVVKASNKKIADKFVNGYFGVSVNYREGGLVILADGHPGSDFKIYTRTEATKFNELVKDAGIVEFYILPNIKCDLKALDVKQSTLVEKNCVELTKVKLRELKPKVIVLDSIYTFNLLTGLKIYSSGKFVNNVMWHKELQCYMILGMDLTQLIVEKDESFGKTFESVKLGSVESTFCLAKSILDGSYKEHIVRFDEPVYKKISFYSPDQEKADILKILFAAPKLAVDIETTGLSLFKHEITTIAFTWGIGKAVVFEWKFVIEHAAVFKKLLLQENQIKIFANGFFDVGFLIMAGFPVKGDLQDILVLNYLKENGIDYYKSNIGPKYSAQQRLKGSNNLKYLTWLFTDLGGYEKEIQALGGIIKAQKKAEVNTTASQGDLFEEMIKKEVNADSDLTLGDMGDFKFKDETFAGSLTKPEAYNCFDVDSTFRIYEYFVETIDSAIINCYQELLKPLIFEVLVPMFLNGIAVDIPYIDSLDKTYATKLEKIEKLFVLRLKQEIQQYPDFDKSLFIKLYKKYISEDEIKNSTIEQILDKIKINMRSNRQLLTLYKGLGYLPVEAKSVDDSVIKHLKDRKGVKSARVKSKYSPIQKLHTTYILPIKNKHIDGFIHSQTHTMFTTTGRLSSSDPNMQNIPASNLIRNIFIARPGYVFLDVDYSQIELRVLAHYTQDPALLKTFSFDDADPHWDMAVLLFPKEIPVDSMRDKSNKRWDKLRGDAKTLNFQILYGATSFGVARALNPDYDYVSKVKLKTYQVAAQKLIDQWFEAVPKVKQWMDSVISVAQEKRYVENMFNRRRWMLFINSNYSKFRHASIREAVNTPIQGTASDICCAATVRWQRFLHDYTDDDCRIVNIVHDNILTEVPEEKAEFFLGHKKTIMVKDSNILSVPLRVDSVITKKWVK